MKKLALILLLSSLIINTSSYIFPGGIDLVALQKKEKLRRSKLKKAKYKITNDNIITIIKVKKKVSFIEVDNESIGEEPEKKKKPAIVEDPKKKEEYWRRRMRIIDENIETCKNNIEKTQSNLNLAQTNFLTADIPERINRSRALVEQLSKTLKDLKVKLIRFEKNKEEFYTEARKAGALPGWLR